MREMNKSSEKSGMMVGVIATISIIITIAFCITWCVKSETKYVEIKYDLSELNNGVYAIYHTTHSTVPAHNYEVITLNCNGNIYTFQGHVQIIYTDENPYVIYHKRNLVNADRMYVYVPSGSVEYQGSIMVR